MQLDSDEDGEPFFKPQQAAAPSSATDQHKDQSDDDEQSKPTATNPESGTGQVQTVQENEDDSP